MDFLIINYFESPKIIDKKFVVQNGALSVAYFLGKELVKKGHKVTVFSPSNIDSEFNSDNIKFVCRSNIINFYDKKIGGLKYLLKLFNYIRSQKFDYLISLTQVITIFLGLFFKNAKKIAVFHDIYYYFYPKRLNNFLLKFFEELSLNLAKSSFEYCVTINDYVKKILNEKMKNEKKVILIGAGTDLAYYKNVKKADKLMFIGRLVKSKGIDKIIRVFMKLSTKYKNLEMSIIGTGNKKEEILKTIKDNNLNIRLLEFTTEEQKIAELKTAKVYVSFSTVEGFGIPLVEAMNYKTVPVVSNISAHKYVFQKQKVGFLVNTEKEMINKVDKLLKDDKLRNELGKNGRELVKNLWNWQKVTERFIKGIIK